MGVTSERRRSWRTEVSLECTLHRRTGKMIEGRTVDIGPGGMRVHTNRPLSVDEVFEFLGRRKEDVEHPVANLGDHRGDGGAVGLFDFGFDVLGYLAPFVGAAPCPLLLEVKNAAERSFIASVCGSGSSSAGSTHGPIGQNVSCHLPCCQSKNSSLGRSTRPGFGLNRRSETSLTTV